MSGPETGPGCPPQLQLSIPPSTTSFKRSFEQFGFDLDDSPVHGSDPRNEGHQFGSSSGASGSRTNRSKRARSASSGTTDGSSSSGSGRASGGSSARTSLSASSSSLNDHRAAVIAAPHPSLEAPPRLPTPDVDVDMPDVNPAQGPLEFPEAYRLTLNQPPVLPPLELEQESPPSVPEEPPRIHIDVPQVPLTITPEHEDEAEVSNEPAPFYSHPSPPTLPPIIVDSTPPAAAQSLADHVPPSPSLHELRQWIDETASPSGDSDSSISGLARSDVADSGSSRVVPPPPTSSSYLGQLQHEHQEWDEFAARLLQDDRATSGASTLGEGTQHHIRRRRQLQLRESGLGDVQWDDLFSVSVPQERRESQTLPSLASASSVIGEARESNWPTTGSSTGQSTRRTTSLASLFNRRRAAQRQGNNGDDDGMDGDHDGEIVGIPETRVSPERRSGPSTSISSNSSTPAASTTSPSTRPSLSGTLDSGTTETHSRPNRNLPRSMLSRRLPFMEDIQTESSSDESDNVPFQSFLFSPSTRRSLAAVGFNAPSLSLPATHRSTSGPSSSSPSTATTTDAPAGSSPTSPSIIEQRQRNSSPSRPTTSASTLPTYRDPQRFGLTIAPDTPRSPAPEPLTLVYPSYPEVSRTHWDDVPSVRGPSSTTSSMGATAGSSVAEERRAGAGAAGASASSIGNALLGADIGTQRTELDRDVDGGYVGLRARVERQDQQQRTLNPLDTQQGRRPPAYYQHLTRILTGQNLDSTSTQDSPSRAMAYIPASIPSPNLDLSFVRAEGPLTSSTTRGDDTPPTSSSQAESTPTRNRGNATGVEASSPSTTTTTRRRVSVFGAADSDEPRYSDRYESTMARRRPRSRSPTPSSGPARLASPTSRRNQETSPPLLPDISLPHPSLDLAGFSSSSNSEMDEEQEPTGSWRAHGMAMEFPEETEPTVHWTRADTEEDFLRAVNAHGRAMGMAARSATAAPATVTPMAGPTATTAASSNGDVEMADVSSAPSLPSFNSSRDTPRAENGNRSNQSIYERYSLSNEHGLTASPHHPPRGSIPSRTSDNAGSGASIASRFTGPYRNTFRALERRTESTPNQGQSPTAAPTQPPQPPVRPPGPGPAVRSRRESLNLDFPPSSSYIDRFGPGAPGNANNSSSGVSTGVRANPSPPRRRMGSVFDYLEQRGVQERTMAASAEATRSNARTTTTSTATTAAGTRGDGGASNFPHLQPYLADAIRDIGRPELFEPGTLAHRLFSENPRGEAGGQGAVATAAASNGANQSQPQTTQNGLPPPTTSAGSTFGARFYTPARYNSDGTFQPAAPPAPVSESTSTQLTQQQQQFQRQLQQQRLQQQHMQHIMRLQQLHQQQVAADQQQQQQEPFRMAIESLRSEGAQPYPHHPPPQVQHIHQTQHARHLLSASHRHHAAQLLAGPPSHSTSFDSIWDALDRASTAQPDAGESAHHQRHAAALDQQRARLEQQRAALAARQAELQRAREAQAEALRRLQEEQARRRIAARNRTAEERSLEDGDEFLFAPGMRRRRYVRATEGGPRRRGGLGGFAFADFMRDEEFDQSYEGLLRLGQFLGDAKPKRTPKEVLDKMEKAKYQDWATEESDKRCPICLDDYSPTDPVMKLNHCSHWLHQECLEQWLQNASTCPVCRKTVHGSGSTTTPSSSSSSSSSPPSDTNAAASSSSTRPSSSNPTSNLTRPANPFSPVRRTSVTAATGPVRTGVFSWGRGVFEFEPDSEPRLHHTLLPTAAPGAGSGLGPRTAPSQQQHQQQQGASPTRRRRAPSDGHDDEEGGMEFVRRMRERMERERRGEGSE